MQTFDKMKLAQVLSTAKGDRSINQFGIACNVDPGYLSRLLRGLLNNPPSPAILAKIAAQASNGVKYGDLLRAAGILDAPEKSQGGEITSLMDDLWREMEAFFRMHSDLTEAKKEALIREMRDYFHYKSLQAGKKK